jgi:hypothetical protein
MVPRFLRRHHGTEIRCNGERIQELPSRRQLQQNAAADFVGILVAAVAEDHDAELPAWHHPDIGRCVVETAVLFDDGRRAADDDLSGQRLPVARADSHDGLLCQLDRLP